MGAMAAAVDTLFHVEAQTNGRGLASVGSRSSSGPFIPKVTTRVIGRNLVPLQRLICARKSTINAAVGRRGRASTLP